VFRRTFLLPHAAFAALLVAVGAFAVTGELAVRNAAQLGAVALMAVCAARRTDARVGWWLVTLANVAWVAADLRAELNPLYLVSYVLAHAGMVLLVCAQARRRWHTGLALDGVLAGLTAAALLTGFIHAALVGPGVTVPATTLAGDAMIVTTMVLAFALSGWRPGRAWWVLAVGEVVLVVADLSVVGAVVPSHAAIVGWAIALVVTSYAVYHPTLPRAARPVNAAAAAGVPIAGGAISLALLMHAGLTDGSALTIGLAGAALAVGLIRTMLLIAENGQLLRGARADAVTDKLTGLPNRRALNEDLDYALARQSAHTLAFFDLDGFKEYNDAFGHGAGDALLQRLAPALAQAAGGGRAYRLGGDEFCVLLEGKLDDDAPPIGLAADALAEHGDGFTISASFGLVVLPDEAGNAPDALRLADERMYARKRSRRTGHRGQARDVLVQVLAERGTGDGGVAALAGEVGRRLGLDAERLDVLIRAAELRDVGMVAVPDEIVAKQGPLDAAEWAIVKQHPIAGERILAAAPSMRPVARLVRAAHERYDGTGYPDGLKGEEIPLGARIISACDALRSGDAELRVSAFDPRVVEALALSAVSSPC
jgi:two-component system cell cycle response regulator